MFDAVKRREKGGGRVGNKPGGHYDNHEKYMI